MKYYALSELGRFNNLKIRTVVYNQTAYKAFHSSLGRGQLCEGMDYGAIDYLGGKRPRFEDMVRNLLGGFMISERICNIIKPFLASPDDVEWLYTPQREDLEQPCPCFGKYFHFNVQRQVKPEDCLEMEFKEHERLAAPYMSDLRFKPEAVEGLHVFFLDYQLNNYFVSEAVMKAARKQKSYLFTGKSIEERMKSLKSLYNGDVPYKLGMSFKETSKT